MIIRLLLQGIPEHLLQEQSASAQEAGEEHMEEDSEQVAGTDAGGNNIMMY